MNARIHTILFDAGEQPLGAVIFTSRGIVEAVRNQDGWTMQVLGIEPFASAKFVLHFIVRFRGFRRIHSNPPPFTSSHVSKSASAARTQPPLPTATRAATS